MWFSLNGLKTSQELERKIPQQKGIITGQLHFEHGSLQELLLGFLILPPLQLALSEPCCNQRMA